MLCQCASIRPGIRVRPPTSMTRAPAAEMGSAVTFSITPPRTRTLLGPDKEGVVTSKMRTFSNNTDATDWALQAAPSELPASVRLGGPWATALPPDYSVPRNKVIGRALCREGVCQYV